MGERVEGCIAELVQWGMMITWSVGMLSGGCGSNRTGWFWQRRRRSILVL